MNKLRVGALGAFARGRVVRLLAIAAVGIAVLAAAAGCSNGNDQIANEVLQTFWPKNTRWGFSESIDKQILDATGETAYEGSDTWPGYWTVTNAPLGAHIVTFQIQARPSGIFWHKGTVTLKYWISQDGEYVKPENSNAQTLWYAYQQ